MEKPLSMDLRPRALAAVDEGMSCRTDAKRFGVAVATVIRWYDQRRNTGGYTAKAQAGHTLPRRIEAHAHTIVALHAEYRNIALDQPCHELGQAGEREAISALHRFFARHGITGRNEWPTPSA